MITWDHRKLKVLTCSRSSMIRGPGGVLKKSRRISWSSWCLAWGCSPCTGRQTVNFLSSPIVFQCNYTISPTTVVSSASVIVVFVDNVGVQSSLYSEYSTGSRIFTLLPSTHFCVDFTVWGLCLAGKQTSFPVTVLLQSQIILQDRWYFSAFTFPPTYSLWGPAAEEQNAPTTVL